MSFFSDKRITVTGGAGFLGSHVVEKLRDAGARQIFVVRAREYDLTREEQVERLYAEHPADLVIHLAGLVGGLFDNQKYPASYFYQNIMMGTLVLHHAWKSGAKKVVAACAGCGYPETAPNPLKEEYFWEGFPQPDSAPYSLAKRMLHVQSFAYWKQYRFPIVVGIPGNIYGPHDNFDLERAHVIPALVRRFVEAADDGKDEVVVGGTGHATRDFVYGGDVAEGLLRAAEGYEGSALVNFSSGTDTTIRAVADLLTDLSGFRGRIVWDTSRPEGQSARRFDVGKAKLDLGWTPRHGLAEGLRKTIAWYRANRSAARNSEPLRVPG